jgi:hypothetical protein
MRAYVAPPKRHGGRRRIGQLQIPGQQNAVDEDHDRERGSHEVDDERRRHAHEQLQATQLEQVGHQQQLECRLKYKDDADEQHILPKIRGGQAQRR